MTFRAGLLVPIMILLSACGGGTQGATTAPGEETEGAKMAIDVRSTAFEEGGAIPPRYTCDGLDVSPPLQWNSVPDGTRSLALISDDPDAPSGTVQGVNGAGTVGYTGPCPPSGTHRYFFKVYALDTELDPGEDLMSAMEGHVLA